MKKLYIILNLQKNLNVVGSTVLRKGKYYNKKMNTSIPWGQLRETHLENCAVACLDLLYYTNMYCTYSE